VHKTFKIAMIGMVAALMLPLAAHAQWWQRHPAYLHAMSDLRQAYWLVQHHEKHDPFGGNEERTALKAIHEAYQALKDASITDDKNIDDQPPADMTFGDHKGRLRQALQLLHDAHNEVAREEEDPAARGFRDDALAHIDKAAKATNAAMHSIF